MTATTARCSLSQVAVVGSATPSPSVESMIPKSISTGTTCPGKITAVFGDITISSSFDSGECENSFNCVQAGFESSKVVWPVQSRQCIWGHKSRSNAAYNRLSKAC